MITAPNFRIILFKFVAVIFNFVAVVRQLSDLLNPLKSSKTKVEGKVSPGDARRRKKTGQD